jgi:penicillin amidase
MERRITRAAALLLALVVVAGLLWVCGGGVRSLPAPARLLDPVNGLWTMAPEAASPPQTLHLPGLRAQTTVTFDGSGVPHVQAARDDDLFLALGYLHARDRLFEMDLFRRQAEGRLAEILGLEALSTDELQLDLGLVRTAQTEWARLPGTSPARAAVLAYTAGVNARIREDEATNRLPAMFKALGYQPWPWAPVDSMLLRGLLAEDLAYQKGPLQAVRLDQSLGTALTAQWFPTLPPNEQHPYASGGSGRAALEAPAVAASTPADDAQHAVATALARLPSVGRHQLFGASNSWAVDGTRSAGGKPLMANDPHLSLTLPSIWYQVDLESPGYRVSGVTIPGAPVVEIGRNRHISWGATDTQAQATLYYQEKTDPDHPDQYLWQGEWRPFIKIPYEIPVRGQGIARHVTRITVHGPVLTGESPSLAVDWVADSPAPGSYDALLGMMRASGWTSFTDALRAWVGPIQNWTYADDQGNIGLIAPGTYPVVAGGDPSRPLPGTGEDDVVGSIPFGQVPMAFDPPDHVLVSANQRPVGPDYPFFIGGTLDTFDPGYRASEILSQLQAPGRLGVADMERIQLDTRDQLAVRLLPSLLKALGSAGLSPQQDRARRALAGWDGRMDASSSPAAIWETFWDAYLKSVFQPWWSARHVPLPYQEVNVPLTEDLEAWTLHDPTNPAFTPPGAAARTAPGAMVAAFQSAVGELQARSGDDIAGWRWGDLHHRAIPSLAQVAGLGYGPVPSGGDALTPDAAGGEPSVHGPSWRMVVDWGSGTAYGIYPGGQSEDPASDHYRDQLGDWLSGRLRPMLWAGDAARQPAAVTVRLGP